MRKVYSGFLLQHAAAISRSTCWTGHADTWQPRILAIDAPCPDEGEGAWAVSPMMISGALCHAGTGGRTGAMAGEPAARGGGGAGAALENVSRTETPKHDVEPASTTHQKARPAIRTGNPAKSAKPPSPVQIRAAPPIFRANSSVGAWQPSARLPIGLRWTTNQRPLAAVAAVNR